MDDGRRPPNGSTLFVEGGTFELSSAKSGHSWSATSTPGDSHHRGARVAVLPLPRPLISLIFRVFAALLVLDTFTMGTLAA